jgi:alpha-tubulin suppressor-like RCC1 family protein
MSKVRRSWCIVAVCCLAALAAGCAPPASSTPDPLIECSQVRGDISYDPPATNSGADITIDALPGAVLDGCVDRTGAGITAGALELSALLPGYLCAVIPTGSEVGAGSGAITWSDGSTSSMSARIRGGSGTFIVELTVDGGRWVGARASVTMGVATADGNCTPADPVTRASLLSHGPIAFHAAETPLLPPRADVAQLDVGGNTTCAVMTDTTVSCWGENSEGQLGNLLLAPGSSTSVPVPVTGLVGATEVRVGGRHACALVAGGQVRCWGANHLGQLGDGTFTRSNVAVAVQGLAGVQQLSLDGDRSCALLPDDTVACWGFEAGPGSTPGGVPTTVAGLYGVDEVSTGAFHTCALAGGEVSCWGRNAFGQLGNGSTSDSATPTAVGGLGAMTSVSSGSEHSCALDAGGAVWCWGFNRYGQLGHGTASDEPGSTPWKVMGELGATAIDLGGETSCAVVVGGAVSCWGQNRHGELGNAVTVDSARPTLALGLVGVSDVRTGGHTCATVPGGRAMCWGNNSVGQLGTGTNESRSVPVPVIDP